MRSLGSETKWMTSLFVRRQARGFPLGGEKAISLPCFCRSRPDVDLAAVRSTRRYPCQSKAGPMDEGLWEAARAVRPYLPTMLPPSEAADVDTDLARLLAVGVSAEHDLRTLL